MFKEGLYEFKYETNSGAQHYIGIVNNIDLHSIMTIIHVFEGNNAQDLVKKWRLSGGDMYKYIKTFNNIHEVSARIKEIEEDKGKIKVWDWVIIPDESGEYYRGNVGSVVGWNYEKDEAVVKWLYGERTTIKASELQKIPELEAICLLTGNRNYELVDDDHDVILRADWDGQEEHIKELQEENKQLRKALVYHGVWPSEDITPVGAYKKAIEKAASPEIVSVTRMEPSEEVKEILPKVNKLQQEAIEALENLNGEAINMATNSEIVSVTKNNPCTRIFKANNQDRTFTINYRDGMILDIHEIVLQLKEKYLS